MVMRKFITLYQILKLIIENPPITTELMKFYTVRNPKPITEQQLQNSYILLPEHIVTNSEIISQMNTILADQHTSSNDKLQQVQSRVQGFVDSEAFVDSVGQWKDIFEPVSKVRNIVNTNNTTLHTELQNFLNPYLDSKIDPSIIQRAWENLIIYNIIGARNETVQYASDIIKTSNLIELIASGTDLKEKKWHLETDVLLPKTIFPLPKRTSTDDGTEENPDTYNEIELLTQDFENAKQASETIETIDEGLTELKIKEKQAFEDIRWKYLNADPLSFDADGNPIFPSDNPLNIDIKKTGILTTEIFDDLTMLTKDLLSKRNIKNDQDSISYVINMLENEKRDLGILISQKLNLNQTVYATAGSILVAPSKADMVLSAKETSLIINDNIGTIIPSGPVIDIVRPGKDILGPTTNPGETVFTDDKGCKVKPLGIADLRRVEQKLICNVPGEIAHIENILKSEVKERATRRLNRVEESTFISTDTESQEERDTITTDRFQMEKATDKVINQERSFEVGVSVSASYGAKSLGTGVSINANTGYSSATSTSEATQQAINYAKDVTDRARKLVIEKNHTEQTRKVIDEFEETNKHLFDNSEGTTHVVGVYRWIDKVYEAQVVNYGKRLMFEMMIPDPAAFHRYAMAAGKIADAVSILKPLDPINDITAIRRVFSGISPLKSAADITESNYMLWAGLYNATVEAPPPSEITIGLAKGAMNFPNDGTKMMNIVTDELDIPQGYVAHSASSHIVIGHSSAGANTAWIYWCCGKAGLWANNWGLSGPLAMNGEQGKIPFTVTGRAESFTISMTLKCTRQAAHLETWKLTAFTAIKTAYEVQLVDYNTALAAAKAQMNEGILTKNPILNRSIEQTELRKHAVRLLSQCKFKPSEAMKADYPGDGVDYPDIHCCQAIADGKLVQFIENCFEFGLMSYNFYPYFWSRKSEWKTIYKLEDADPIFTQFLQAGYARVIVPVRVGFEKAALRYVADGTIWEGGDPPGINDLYYVSLIDELEEPIGTAEGDPWQIRIPTSLTILQKDADGIDESGLPCDPDGL